MYNRFRYGDTFVKGSSMAQQQDAPIDPNFDPMYNRFRYGDTFVKGSSVAQTGDAPIDSNFDPMYNRFRYGDTFVKGSSFSEQRPTEASMLQINDEICETVECAKQQAAQRQAQLDAGGAEADAKRKA